VIPRTGVVAVPTDTTSSRQQAYSPGNSCSLHPSPSTFTITATTPPAPPPAPALNVESLFSSPIFSARHDQALFRDPDIFGFTYARGEAGAKSDIDILVRFARKKSLFEIVRIENELRKSLHRDVDLVTENAVSPYLADTILRDAVVIYDAKGPCVSPPHP
jgi:uncharacterized protein